MLSFRLTELKHAIGLAKLNYVELGRWGSCVLGREAVGVLKGRPRISHHVSHCVAPPAPAIGLLILMTCFRLARLMPYSSFQIYLFNDMLWLSGGCLVNPTTCFSSASLHSD